MRDVIVVVNRAHEGQGSRLAGDELVGADDVAVDEGLAGEAVLVRRKPVVVRQREDEMVRVPYAHRVSAPP